MMHILMTLLLHIYLREDEDPIVLPSGKGISMEIPTLHHREDKDTIIYYPSFGKPNIHGHSYYSPSGPSELEHQQWQHYYNLRDPPYYPDRIYHGLFPSHMLGPIYHQPPPQHYDGYDNGPPPPPPMGSPHRTHRSPHPPPGQVN